MKVPRILITTIVAGAALLASACGSATGATPVSSGSPPAGSNGARRGAAGELAQIKGTTLILNGQSGDITVDTTSATQVQKTSTATVADIVPGSCMIASGQKDATGVITAQVVRLSAKQNGSCALGRPGGRAPGASPDTSPGAGRRPGGQANGGFVVGEVTTVSGTSVTVQPPTGVAQTVIVPTTVRVSRSSPAGFSDLVVGECVQAGGPRDPSGTVKATNLNIVPPGPSGCFTGGGFGGPRGAGGGPGGGAGGGAPRGD